MNVVPNLKYESYKIERNRNVIRRNNVCTENSISIESSDEGELEDSGYSLIHDNGKIYSNEKEFQLEIDKLKLQSNIRFKNKWENILEKYSKINDDKESDEIDLGTGEIIIDNGHLKSLRSTITGFDGVRSENNIWSQTYDVDRDIAIQKQKEYRERRRKRELKSNLKNNDLFYNANLHRKSISKKNINFNYDSDNDINQLEDNLVLLNPSPTKKLRLSPFKTNSSPIKASDIHFLSPTKGKIPIENTYNSSPIKGSTPEISYFEQSTPNKNSSSIIDLEESFKNINDTNNIVKSTILKRLEDTNIHEQEVNRTSEFIVSDSSNNDSFEKEELKTSTEHSRSLDFDELFSIESNSFLGKEGEVIIESQIYQCAFENCNYCTGNKYIYQSHLLDFHAVELFSIGYPINITNNQIGSKETVSTETISKLNKDFPLSVNIPPLPLSIDGKPIICNLPFQEKKCQKAFLSKFDLKRHQSNYPKQCSIKKQVYICPILGCGYMTDEGYLNFRNHFVEKQHHILPSLLQKDDDSSNKFDFYSNYEMKESILSKKYIKQELDDMFSQSDSEFSEELSDTEKDSTKSINNPITEEILKNKFQSINEDGKYPKNRRIIHGEIPNLFQVDDIPVDELLQYDNDDDGDNESSINALFD